MTVPHQSLISPNGWCVLPLLCRARQFHASLLGNSTCQGCWSPPFCAILMRSMQWWVGQCPRRCQRLDCGLQDTSSSLGPWANSIFCLIGPLELGTGFLCEGRNPKGDQALSILPASPKGLIQRVFYGAIAMTLLLLRLCPLM
uniref:Uncharacterized protein n=1 Tax=Sus scrofa TaxID=9823 RepID=A0A8D0N2Q2_PIG